VHVRPQPAPPSLWQRHLNGLSVFDKDGDFRDSPVRSAIPTNPVVKWEQADVHSRLLGGDGCQARFPKAVIIRSRFPKVGSI
jgi:hypothetical protein